MSGDGIIFAPATGGRAAIRVIRLSGAGTGPLLADLAGGLPKPRRASLRRLRAADGAPLDQALVLWFPGPGSYTGEDYAELHVHGGMAVLQAVSAALVAAGARPAEPGEFSRRAFFNGKLDLLQAEGIADLIEAETEAQRRLALDQAEGALAVQTASWRGALTRLLAQQTALIDFSDEDLPDALDEGLRRQIEALIGELDAALAAGAKAARLREGLDFAVLGAPNAGKSTLVNAIAGEDVAIVSDIPGTTRDAVGVRLSLGGVPVRLTDTAGLREAADAIEAEGVRRARTHGARADLVILVAAAPDPVWPEMAPENCLRVLTKADLAAKAFPGALAVSALTGDGMERLTGELAAAARRLTDAGSVPALGRPRQIACIREMRDALERALQVREAELRAEELQAAAAELGRLTGIIGVEEVLGEVFGSFCIGK
ncbi:MAG TPA: tRNA uridine-5-carboxymethylaminomethyl(34) synthesis GTPase MnmE [Acetobacteraceae bacterium]|nr:tRNA uridine-5-carboxymethylaminomethyl(34) synthesis GTPase MnmE [Acetobacteraceae bacterium]